MFEPLSLSTARGTAPFSSREVSIAGVLAGYLVVPPAGLGSDPVVVNGLDGHGILSGVADAISPQLGPTCAVFSAGGVDCWGLGLAGELEPGTPRTPRIPLLWCKSSAACAASISRAFTICGTRVMG